MTDRKKWTFGFGSSKRVKFGFPGARRFPFHKSTLSGRRKAEVDQFDEIPEETYRFA